MLNIIGHERQIQYLEKALKNGRLAHAYLFHGPESVGKFAVAKYFVGKLNCPHPIILDLENTLVSKKVPRPTEVGRDGGPQGLAKKRKDIPIEDIRELKRLFSLSAAGDEWRAAIINEAEKLSPEAADAFLKLLEEPGDKTLFLLVTSSLDLIPPTITSRSQQIRFSEVSGNIISEFLSKKGVGGEEQKEILFLAAGRPGVAVRMMEDRKYLSAQKKLLQVVQGILRNQELPQAFILTEKVAPDEEMRKKMVEYIVRIVRAGLLRTAPGEMASRLNSMRNIVRISEILETTNVNPRLALDSIFIEALVK